MNHNHLSICWKNTHGVATYLDLYPPTNVSNKDLSMPTAVPVVIYYHGGGLIVGNRKNWFPTWMCKRASAAGYAFISTDYRLMPPSTGHDLLQDIKDLFTYIANGGLDSYLDKLWQSREYPDGWDRFHIDRDAIAVAGSSAGGLCAYLAAIHAHPKPRGVVSMFGTGGDMLTSLYLDVKTKPVFTGRPLINPSDFQEYLYPDSKMLENISDSSIAFNNGIPINRRMLVAAIFLQLGVYLDYYTGEHEPSLSASLRKALEDLNATPESSDSDISKKLYASIPPQHLPLFPQFNISREWPPVFLCHGSSDTAVPVEESLYICNLLQHEGVPVELKIVEGKDHFFDSEQGAEEMYGAEVFDRVGHFLTSCLGKNTGNSNK